MPGGADTASTGHNRLEALSVSESRTRQYVGVVMPLPEMTQTPSGRRYAVNAE